MTFAQPASGAILTDDGLVVDGLTFPWALVDVAVTPGKYGYDVVSVSFLAKNARDERTDPDV